MLATATRHTKSLFTGVRGETVWKSGIGPESELRRRPRGAEEPLTAASCGLSSAIETASALFQTVSEGVFSEVPGQSRGPCACEGAVIASAQPVKARIWASISG